MTASAPRVSDRSDREDFRLEAARKRLRESVGQADTLEAIREIVTNLLGCEEIGLFALKHGGSELLWSFGIDTQRHATLDSFAEPAMHLVLQGKFHVTPVPYQDQHDHENPPLRVYVPIRLKAKTVAVLVMLTLLPQKVGFDEADLNLVKLLSEEAARALFDEGSTTNA